MVHGEAHFIIRWAKKPEGKKNHLVETLLTEIISGLLEQMVLKTVLIVGFDYAMTVFRIKYVAL